MCRLGNSRWRGHGRRAGRPVQDTVVAIASRPGRSSSDRTARVSSSAEKGLARKPAPAPTVVQVVPAGAMTQPDAQALVNAMAEANAFEPAAEPAPVEAAAVEARS